MSTDDDQPLADVELNEIDEAEVVSVVQDDQVDEATVEQPTEAAAEADPQLAVVLKVPTKARLAQAQEAVAEFSANIETPDVVVDASEVEEISTPYILTLVSYLASRDDEMKKVGVLNATPSFIDAFSDLGLFQELMKMEFRT